MKGLFSTLLGDVRLRRLRRFLARNSPPLAADRSISPRTGVQTQTGSTTLGPSSSLSDKAPQRSSKSPKPPASGAVEDVVILPDPPPSCLERNEQLTKVVYGCDRNRLYGSQGIIDRF